MTEEQNDVRSIQETVTALHRAWAANRPSGESRLHPHVIAFGPGAGGVYVGPGPSWDGVGQPLEDTCADLGRTELVPGQVRVGLAESRRSGWFWAIPGDARRTAPADRFSGMVVRDQDGGWSVLHAHLSVGRPNEQVPAYLGRGVTPARVGDGVQPGAEHLVELLTSSMGATRRDVQARGTTS